MRNKGYIPSLSRFAFAALLAAILAGPPAWGGDKTSAGKVKIKPTTEKGPDGSRVVKLHLTVEKDWYIYANPVGDEMLAPNATTVTVARAKASDVKITYPKGKFKKDGDFAYHYYVGDVTSTATVQNASGPLEFNVQVNACKKNQCLPTGEIKLSVP